MGERYNEDRLNLRQRSSGIYREMLNHRIIVRDLMDGRPPIRHRPRRYMPGYRPRFDFDAGGSHG